MLLPSLLFLLGLVVLIGGGEALIRGAATIAKSAGVPPVAVGLTVVAFGTSSPEFVVAITASLSGASGVSFGNVVGANIINISLILGVTALFIPLMVNTTIVTREIPMASVAILATAFLSFDAVLGGAPDQITRGDGLVLLLLFGVFVYYTANSLRVAKHDKFVQAAHEVGWQMRVQTIMRSVGLTVLGLVSMAIGGNLLVDNAIIIATALGMTQTVIGLTIVAIGTTMPELVASLLAVQKGEPDLAVGSIVGSNIFNLLAVLGTAAVINPIEVSMKGHIAILIATGLTLLLLVLCTTDKFKLVRREGVILLVIFASYMAWMFHSS